MMSAQEKTDFIRKTMLDQVALSEMEAGLIESAKIEKAKDLQAQLDRRYYPLNQTLGEKNTIRSDTFERNLNEIRAFISDHEHELHTLLTESDWLNIFHTLNEKGVPL